MAIRHNKSRYIFFIVAGLFYGDGFFVECQTHFLEVVDLVDNLLKGVVGLPLQNCR